MPRPLLMSSLAFVAAHSAVALRKAAAGQEPACLQKERIKDVVDIFAKEATNQSEVSKQAGCPPVHFIDPPRTREDLGATLNRLGLRGVGVEVGVQQGLYSKVLLEKWQHADLYVQVDLWEHQENYKDVANFENSIHEEFMKRSCSYGELMKQQGYVGEVIQCKDYSTECVKFFKDSSIDFLYVDARHDRKGVLEDLAAYWPKMKVGGVIAGHDYMEQFEVTEIGQDGQDWTKNFDGSVDDTGRVVKGAVNDFFSGSLPSSPKDLQECPRQPVITYREKGWNTWIVRK